MNDFPNERVFQLCHAIKSPVELVKNSTVPTPRPKQNLLELGSRTCRGGWCFTARFKNHCPKLSLTEIFQYRPKDHVSGMLGEKCLYLHRRQSLGSKTLWFYRSISRLINILYFVLYYLENVNFTAHQPLLFG